jgi:predicted MPP superfamily phosphohydrolase
MPIGFRILFGVVMAGLLGGLHVYLYRRLVRDVTQKRTVRLSAASVFGVGTATILFGFMRYRSIAPSTLTAALPWWLAIIIYVSMAVMAVDLIVWLALRGRGRSPAPLSPERRLFLSRAVATTGVIAGGGLASFGAWRAFAPPRITEVSLKLAKLPRALDGFTIVQLSDVHIGPVLKRAFLDELVDRANSCKPDLVAITGDLVDGSPKYIGSVVEGVTRLKSRFGTYFCTGNHDYYSGCEEWVSELHGWGVNVLRNRRVVIGDAGGSFDLLGVDDWGARGMTVHDYDLDKAMDGRVADRASVLLAHQPANFDEVAARGIDLQLSGHTHGGQTFPATGVASLIWGDRAAGLSKTHDSYLFVSRGCGFVGPPTRLGSPPEVVKIVLSAG